MSEPATTEGGADRSAETADAASPSTEDSDPATGASEHPSPAELEHPVILFDGVCNLCSGAVQFVVDRDPDGRFRFAPLQSDVGRSLMRDLGRDPEALDTFVLIEGDRSFAKSDAALRIARHLEGPIRHVWVLRWIPRLLRNVGYDLVARLRYPIFGRKDRCMRPTPELQSRFLAMNEG